MKKREVILKVENLKQHFQIGSKKRGMKVRAVDGISFDIYKGEVFGLVGESGSGKTTTGRAIIKLYNATGGNVYFKDTRIVAGLSEYRNEIRRANKDLRREKVLAKNSSRELYEINHVTKEKIAQLKKDIELSKASNKSAKKIVKRTIIEEKKERKHHQKKSYQTQEKILMKELGIYDRVRNFQKERRLLVNQMLDENDLKFNEYFEKESAKFKNATKEISNRTLKKITPDTSLQKKNKLLNKKQSKDAAEIYDLRVKRDKRIAKIRKKHSKITDKFVKIQRKKADAYLKKVSLEHIKVLRTQKPLLKQETKNAANEKCAQVIKEAKQIFSNQKFENDSQITVCKTEILALENDMKEKSLKIKQYYESNPDEDVVDVERIKLLQKENISFVKQQRKLMRNAYFDNKMLVERKEKKSQKENINRRLQLINAEINNLNQQYHLISDQTPNAASLPRIEESIRRLELEASIARRTYNVNRNLMKEIQMIFQDPISSLNPRMTVREIIAEGLTVSGMKDKSEIEQKVQNILEIVGLSPEHATRYPHEFSGGQRQRIGIARALIVNPSLLIADEPISALDVSIQAQVINLLQELRQKLDLTILFIAHDLSVVKYFSERIAVMYLGKIVEMAPSEKLFANPLHPYTKSLLSAIPTPDPNFEKKRQRFEYHPELEHNYTAEMRPSFVEIEEEHFIYASAEELEKYRQVLKSK